MDVLRQRLIFLFHLADKSNKLRIYYSKIHPNDAEILYLHSKMFIIDDSVLKVGSSNISNRSMSLDTECDVVVSAEDNQRTISKIREIRHRLISEHLGITPQKYTEIENDKGSMISAIESLNSNTPTLAPLKPTINEKEVKKIAEMKIIDPEEPIGPKQLIAYFLGDTDKKSLRLNFNKLALIILGLLLVVLLWSISSVKGFINTETALLLLNRSLETSWMHALYAFVFIALSIAGMPATILVGLMGILFGPVEGSIMALITLLISAVISYSIGHYKGINFVAGITGRKVNQLGRRMTKRGVWTMIVIRILPLAPFAIINMMAGASRIRFRNFFIGTLIGSLPGIIILTLFFSYVMQILDGSNFGNIILWILLIMILLLLAGGTINYFIKKSEG
jgi:phospholipase D1/2